MKLFNRVELILLFYVLLMIIFTGNNLFINKKWIYFFVLIFFILCLISFRKTLLTLPFLLPFQYKGMEVLTFHLSIVDIAIFIIIIFFILYKFLFNEKIIFYKDFSWLFLFVIVSLISTGNNIEGLNYFFRFLEVIIIFFILYSELAKIDDFNTFVKNTLIILVLTGVYNIYEFFFFKKGFTILADKENLNQYRVLGLLNQSNEVGIFLVTFLPAVFLFSVFRKIKKDKLGIIVFVISLGIIFTFSRAALLAYLLFFIIGPFNKKVKKILVLLFLIVIILFPNIVTSREKSIKNRLERYKLLPKMVWDAPFIGHGLRSFEKVYTNLAPKEKAIYPSSHSLYLQLLVETGALGFLVFFFFLLSIFNSLKEVEFYDKNIYRFLYSYFMILVFTQFFINNLVSLYFWIDILFIIKFIAFSSYKKVNINEQD